MPSLNLMLKNFHCVRRVLMYSRSNFNSLVFQQNMKINSFPHPPTYRSILMNKMRIIITVVEVPRWTSAKMEINLKECLNPVKRDITKGMSHFVSNRFPRHGYIWNSGALPQTRKDHNFINENTKTEGDNDPID